MGDIRNLGFEIVLNAAIVRTKAIDWNVSINASHNSTKILSLPETKMLDPDNGYKGFTENSRWYKVGGPLYNAFRHKYAGVNENGEALYYVDSSLDGKPTDLALLPTKSPQILTMRQSTNLAQCFLNSSEG